MQSSDHLAVLIFYIQQIHCNNLESKFISNAERNATSGCFHLQIK